MPLACATVAAAAPRLSPAMADFTGDDLHSSRFERVDLTGAEFRAVDLSHARFRGVDLKWGSDARRRPGRCPDRRRDPEPSDQRCRRRAPRRRGARPASPRPGRMRPTDPDGFREAWGIVERLWDGTVGRARGLDPRLLHESGGRRWSFVETLRHWCSPRTAWVRQGILGDPSPWDPLDLPWDRCRTSGILGTARSARRSTPSCCCVRTGWRPCAR